MIKMITALLVLITLTACSDYFDYSVKKTNVEAVYWHERGRYSVAVKNHATGEITMKELPTSNADLIKVIADVKNGEPWWYVCNYQYDRAWGSEMGGCEIHIVDINSINTSDWNRGKFGTGSTTRVH